jgi:hypothetical protein
MRTKSRVPPVAPSGPIIARPTSPGAISDTTPMAILPAATFTARSLASIDGSYEISGRLHERRDTPEAWRMRTDADEVARARCWMR